MPNPPLTPPEAEDGLMTTEPLSFPPVVSLLTEERQAYLTVQGDGPPHVTPMLYGLGAGRIGFFAEAGTLKTRILAKHEGAGVLVRRRRNLFLASGSARLVDLLSPRSLVRGVGELPGGALLTASFTVRNAVDLVGFARDAVRGRAGAPPMRRALVSFRPERALFVSPAGLRTWGDWPGATPGGGAGHEHAHLDVELAAETGAGPLPLPGRWDPRREEVEIPRWLADIVRFDGGPVAIVVDDYGRPGPAAKQGMLLKGEGRVVDRRDDALVLAVDTDRVATWDGVDTESVAVT
jgi:hypothetical protein